MAARGLDFLVCGAINEPRLSADGSFPNNASVCIAPREPWPPGNANCGSIYSCRSLVNRAHMKESDHLVTLAQEFGDTDQVLFASGLLLRD